MKLLNVRSIFTANSSIGKLYVDGVFLCYILEPFDRGLSEDMPLVEIQQKKVFAHTAVPTGIYPLTLISGEPIVNRFPWIRKYYPEGNFFVPELQNVIGFDAILLHPGNYPKDTEGCSLVGMSIAGADFIGDTPDAFVKLQQVCFDAIKAGGVTYEIQRDENAWQAFKATV
jgi:hypothetical protein